MVFFTFVYQQTNTMKIIISTLLLFVAFQAISQEHLNCGTDEMHQKLFLEHPEYNDGIKRAYNRLQAETAAYIQQMTPKSGNPYVIPVVFHIIHNYGPENIDDSQVLDAVRLINEQYRKRNADTTGIVTDFKSRAADCEIEFRIAQLDPNGNCTSGITRTVSPLTKIGDHQVKSLIQWPPDKYLNVYICEQAAGLAGHSMMPPAADTIPQWDGIVMQHAYVGSIGTSSPFKRTVLSHEIGHFLNLQHIWGGNNVPDYFYLPVADAGNCAFDDDVMDTPATIGWQTCNTNGQSCGSLDNVQNYMDYSYCALMFTEGQKTRMHAALNSTVANRFNLWQTANLIATGTDDITYYLCTAIFDASKKLICAGGSVDFTDISSHGVTSREWTFAGGTATNTTDSLTTVTYATPGKYDVRLKVGNGTTFIDTTLVDFITVLPATGSLMWMNEGFEYQPDYFQKWRIDEIEAPINWSFTPVGFESFNSFFIDNFGTSIPTTYGFQSDPIDVSGLSQVAISFDWAYAKINGSLADQLRLSISNNCGETWQATKTLTATALRTVADIPSGPFIPSSDADWKNTLVASIPASFRVNNLMVRFTFDNKGQNNIYIDNIQIGHPDALKTPLLTNQIYSVYPNPAQKELNFEMGESHGVQEIQIIATNGQIVKTFDNISSEAHFSLSLDGIQNGLYLIQMNGIHGNQVIRQVIAN